ncbi:hypothetical protein FKM82_025281 [Ascaphus truei]
MFCFFFPPKDAKENPYGEEDNKSPFPLQPKTKRSYAQNVTVWIKPSGLQTDVQKILRNARKLPEKTQTFYKVRGVSLGVCVELSAEKGLIRECFLHQLQHTHTGSKKRIFFREGSLFRSILKV